MKRIFLCAVMVAATAIVVVGCDDYTGDDHNNVTKYLRQFNYSYTVAVSSDGIGATGGGSYKAGETVIITAGTAPAGQKFKNWTTPSSGVTFADANSAATTFTMPANAVTVTAVFGHTVTVTSAGTGATGGGTYVQGEKVTITAGTAPSGQQFKNWTATPSVVFANATKAATTFTMPANAVTVTAVFTYTTFTDNRNGQPQTYKTVVIGGERWMAENLNYQPLTGNSWCYLNSNDSCAKYGRLYDWSTAKAVCPSGWHLPTSGEWDKLMTSVGGSSTASKVLKSTSGWLNSNGTDKYEFSALPGGYRNSGGGFNGIGVSGWWWTATEYYSDNAYRRTMANQDYEYEGYYNKSSGFSVRCVADN